MKGLSRSVRAGFTLIELMIVVCIVGVLAVLAVYGVSKYVAHSKTAEATNSVGEMAKDATMAYEREGMAGTVMGVKTSTGVVRHLCGSATASVPASATSIQGRKYQSTVSEWNRDYSTNAGFACLKFTIDQPQYYMYSYTASGTSGHSGDTFTAQAQGDLNGDTVLSLYQLKGSITANYVLYTAPNFVIVRPED
jgi:type IV pilus assembly protein PilA